MPAPVANVAWKCPQCGKRKWFKPGVAKARQFCSRECHAKAMRVENPVREKRAQRLARYGIRNCPFCKRDFEAKTQTQTYCSQDCQTDALHARQWKVSPGPRPCEICGTVFTPRRGNAGRFCSRPCTYAGNRGEKSYAWKGGRQKLSDGYILVKSPGHHRAQGVNGYVLEHILVAEEKLGRPLEKHETVHHINGDRADNRPENLQVRSGRHGKGAVGRCADCGSHNVIWEKLPAS